MSELIQQYVQPLIAEDGGTYEVLAYGERRADDTWEGWLEFHPLDETLSVRRTERETTQPNRDALVYWASGLEPLYFEGAFARAQ